MAVRTRKAGIKNKRRVTSVDETLSNRQARRGQPGQEDGAARPGRGPSPAETAAQGHPRPGHDGAGGAGARHHRSAARQEDRHPPQDEARERPIALSHPPTTHTPERWTGHPWSFRPAIPHLHVGRQPMPEKTQQLRARRAKAKGTTLTVKATDIGDVPAGQERPRPQEERWHRRPREDERALRQPAPSARRGQEGPEPQAAPARDGQHHLAPQVDSGRGRRPVPPRAAPQDGRHRVRRHLPPRGASEESPQRGQTAPGDARQAGLARAGPQEGPERDGHHPPRRPAQAHTPPRRLSARRERVASSNVHAPRPPHPQGLAPGAPVQPLASRGKRCRGTRSEAAARGLTLGLQARADAARSALRVPGTDGAVVPLLQRVGGGSAPPSSATVSHASPAGHCAALVQVAVQSDSSGSTAPRGSRCPARKGWMKSSSSASTRTLKASFDKPRRRSR